MPKFLYDPVTLLVTIYYSGSDKAHRCVSFMHTTLLRSITDFKRGCVTGLKLFFKQYPYCNFIGMILQYTGIIKGEWYLVLQTINRLFCPKEVVIVVHHHSIRGLSKCV